MSSLYPEHSGFPLYDPRHEHDGCGVGFIADIGGRRRHDLVGLAVQALDRLAHRGAVAADARTGDGAGITLGVSGEFFGDEYTRLTGRGVRGRLAVGAVFLPRVLAGHTVRSRRLIERVLEDRGLRDFVWRVVPVVPEVLGVRSVGAMPCIEHLLIHFGEGVSRLEIDRVLYVVRREIEMRARLAGLQGLYIASLSCRTLVYKGLMMSGAWTLSSFYPDLVDPRMKTSFVAFHQRFSTNTYPAWPLAQPFRMLGHNGEINTIIGGCNSVRLLDAGLESPIWGEDIAWVTPVLGSLQSDSASLDNVAELLALSGRSLLHVMIMLLPEAWERHANLSAEVRAFYEYHACLNEPWDGPSAVIFTDGDVVGARLDRNGLRPVRYQRTEDGVLIVGSEVGLLDCDAGMIAERGRLGPGEMIAVDLQKGGVLDCVDSKAELAAELPYQAWIAENLVRLAVAECAPGTRMLERLGDLTARQAAFGYSKEEIKFLFEPMALEGQEPVSSMGDDTPLAVLSHLPRLLPTYFKQRFAQVTNPPIDPIRERLVMSLTVHLGKRLNWLAATAEHARQIELAGPVVTCRELQQIEDVWGAERVARLQCVFPVGGGSGGLYPSLVALCERADEAVEQGAEVLILSDTAVDAEHAPIPILLAVGAVNNHLFTTGRRLRVSVIAESGEPREVHHFATLIGYGACAVHPYLAIQTIAQEVGEENEGFERRLANFIEVIENGLLKVMSKMGISALSSYRGAQIFEAIGLSRDVIEAAFPNTASPVGGIGFEGIAREALMRHSAGFAAELKNLADLGYFRYRREGELHAWSPQLLGAMGKFRKEKPGAYAAFSKEVSERESPIHLRDLLRFKGDVEPVPVEEVESVEAIRTRFTTAAMSLGALSPEAHAAIAIAMNRIGGKSNTGEGGEDPRRYEGLENGDRAESAIKQVASARFGVTPEYLVRARELEIKIAQGSKPGEGGQLPGHKVTEYIAELRHATPGVPLISPPPHHDIYSIEDLAQLIYDLKQINPVADICVKLVAEAGVGTIAAGVAKAYADVILISGHDGGTGASPLSSIKNAGSSWELGLAEVQQVLVLNGLRERVKLRVDGGLKTGRDIVIAAMLGAEEYNFGTAALVAIGCRYVRQCHLDTCPVGIATQRADLRTKFDGNPGALVAYFTEVANEVREILAMLGVCSIQEIVGRTDMLEQVGLLEHPKANLLDLSALLAPPNPAFGAPFRTWPRNVHPAPSLTDRIVADARSAIDQKTPVKLAYSVLNTDRAVGTRLAGEIAARWGNGGLAAGTIQIELEGSAGQSLGAFMIEGMRVFLRGEANDYVGKGMAGGELVIACPIPNERRDVIVGNTVLYGATGGVFMAGGAAGERFAVRNSGATAVVEGVGDHGCEYMTAGLVVVLGNTGRNFGAGMTGGLAYVYDPQKRLPGRCHRDFVVLENVSSEHDQEALCRLITRHQAATKSFVAAAILGDWPAALHDFWKVVPLAGGASGEVIRRPH